MADIFDRMFAGTSTIGENTKLLTEKATVNSNLEEAKTKRIEVACQLGILVYNKIVSGELSAEAFGDFYPKMLECDSEIKGLENRLLEIEREQQALQQQAQEPQPVFVMPVQYVTPGATPPPTSTAASGEAGSVKFCSACGGSNLMDSKFCTKCGNPFK